MAKKQNKKKNALLYSLLLPGFKNCLLQGGPLYWLHQILYVSRLMFDTPDFPKRRLFNTPDFSKKRMLNTQDFSKCWKRIFYTSDFCFP